MTRTGAASPCVHQAWRSLAAAMEPGSTAGKLIFENLRAAPFASAVTAREAGDHRRPICASEPEAGVSTYRRHASAHP